MTVQESNGVRPPASWFDTDHPFRTDVLIDQAVAEAAVRFADRPALVTDDGAVLTHAEIGALADRFARRLHEWGIGRGDFVGIYCDHVPQAIAAVVGTLRAGAAYVPLDPRWPAARIEGLLADLAARAVVTDAAHVDIIRQVRPRLADLAYVVCVDIDDYTWDHAVDRPTVVDLWNTVAGDPDPAKAAGFNFSRPDEVSAADVAAYPRYVAGLVQGDGVLEVGCGTGLVADELIPHCTRYLGIDPSDTAVTRARAWRTTDDNVRFETGFAHDLPASTDEPFDVALFASTVQFFPDTDYLAEALGRAAALVRPGGTVVVADVIDPDRERHAGLTLRPEYFTTLAATHPAFADATVLVRPEGTFEGTLGGRYDVVLRTTGVAGPPGSPAVSGWSVVEETPADAPVVADRTPDDLAYVIFTSGSTGRPKGVVIRHRSVLNLLDWVAATYEVGPTDRLLFSTSFAFDLSVYDMFGLLAAGGSIHLVRDEHRAEPGHLAAVLESGTITFWDSAPAALSAVLPFVEPAARDGLRLVFLSGDWVPLSMKDNLAARFPGATLVALGGATEATVWSNHFLVDHVDPAWASVPYGRPMWNSRYYVLDGDGEHCPVGESGDLVIAGECVAAGYWGDAELTARKFVPDPWYGGTMYRTGDRARFMPDGNLEFLGRLDDQIKVRGYRVELGEVRAAIASVPGVRDVAVVAPPGADGNRLATCYVKADGGPDPDQLRVALTELLPSYLVPDQILVTDVLPVSANGKVDQDALLALASQAAEPTTTVAPTGTPASETARAVYDCWTAVFGAPPAHGDVNFLKDGGSSLDAARLAAKLKSRTGVRLTVGAVLRQATPAAIIELVDAQGDKR